MLELDIIIVGAGITGLASAIALSRAGHNVQVGSIALSYSRLIVHSLARFWKGRLSREMLDL
jgi:flavin-dependent dehydrogenase